MLHKVSLHEPAPGPHRIGIWEHFRAIDWQSVRFSDVALNFFYNQISWSSDSKSHSDIYWQLIPIILLFSVFIIQNWIHNMTCYISSSVRFCITIIHLYRIDNISKYRQHILQYFMRHFQLIVCITWNIVDKCNHCFALWS